MFNPRNPAQRRYTRSVGLLSVVYVLLLLGVVAYFRDGAPHGVVAYVAAVLPALPIVGMFVVIGRYLVDERDEYLRMQVVRQALIATGFTLSAATVWGFLESFGLVDHVDAYWAVVLWFGGLGVVGGISRLRRGALEE